MKMNGFDLPSLFVDMISTGMLKRKVGSWNLIKNSDAYGHHLETELGDVFNTIESIAKATNELPIGFQSDGGYGVITSELHGFGAIPDIVDFTHIICFAISGDGSPFCFDYRESINSPSIIWWDDIYWRKIAPDFDEFQKLFNLHPN
jgi:hypothetical protein